MSIEIMCLLRRSQGAREKNKTRALASKIVAKELKVLKKSEKKKVDKDQELGLQTVSVLKESQQSSNGNFTSVSVSSGSVSTISTL